MNVIHKDLQNTTFNSSFPDGVFIFIYCLKAHFLIKTLRKLRDAPSQTRQMVTPIHEEKGPCDLQFPICSWVDHSGSFGPLQDWKIALPSRLATGITVSLSEQLGRSQGLPPVHLPHISRTDYRSPDTCRVICLNCAEHLLGSSLQTSLAGKILKYLT